ncbi:hypothetical protein Cyast_0646 [Cyanobacterium stanieri PCC 7202]|uniref:Uncharacterized protein n=1 Tax=Cyanobacterium stanieri (strain ATCC 29140 / PCC 7202) TaxID=292563 RepID=K9YJH8_CYASC|nr:hypothetical protein Cyast_0646 [Cyanobacterium stanieri PCC 7202]
MLIQDIKYVETVSHEEVKGGFSEALANAIAAAQGRAISLTSSFTDTFSSSEIGAKIAVSLSGSSSFADV